MLLDKAIELLKLYERAAYTIPFDDFLEATKLGIEALNRVKQSRELGWVHQRELLPGETKDIKRGMTETQFINPERD